MDDNERCQVRITGVLSSPLSRRQSLTAFANLLQISFDEACERLAHLPALVRAGLSKSEAMKYQRVLERLGFECRVDVAV